MRPHIKLRLGPAVLVTVAYVLTCATAGASQDQGATFPSSPLPGPAISITPPSHPVFIRTSLGLRHVDLNVLDGHSAVIAGVLRPSLAARRVALQAQMRGRWLTLAHVLTGARGRFVLHFKPSRAVSERVRLRFSGDANDRPSRRSLGRLNAYRVVLASWYGGGGSLACGGTLTGSTMGVANKTLPCGTLVTLRYNGRIVRVPVIDRGPYVAGREFDLTEATSRALGFSGVASIWSTS